MVRNLPPFISRLGNGFNQIQCELANDPLTHFRLWWSKTTSRLYEWFTVSTKYAFLEAECTRFSKTSSYVSICDLSSSFPSWSMCSVWVCVCMVPMWVQHFCCVSEAQDCVSVSVATMTISIERWISIKNSFSYCQH